MELRESAIVLRPWREEDAPAVHAACQDVEIQRWIPVIPRPYTAVDAHAFVTNQLGLGPHRFDLGLKRLELITDPENVVSQRVAEKVGFRREGVLRSHLRHPDGRRRDSVMFSLLPGELRV